MTKTIFICLLSIFSYSFLVAQNEVPSQNYLEWGSIKIPLNDLINGTNANIRLQLDEILNSASEPMVLYKNGKNAKLKSFSFFITKENKTASPQFVNVENYDKNDAMDTHGRAYLKEHLFEGEYIYLTKLKGQDGEEHFITIQILYKNPPLVLDFILPQIPKGEVFGFQIEEIKNQKTLVKLDTVNADANNQRIFNTYKNYDNYQIIHIPNFKTTRRYLTKKDFLEIPNETIINLVENQTIKDIVLLRIPEFSDYDGEMIELKWGEMKTSDNRKSARPQRNRSTANSQGTVYTIKDNDYDLYDLMDALGSRFLLSQGFQTFPIKRMKVVFFNQKGHPISYITDDINNPELQKVLEKTEPNTIILMTNIVVENKQDEIVYFPPSFIFAIK